MNLKNNKTLRDEFAMKAMQGIISNAWANNSRVAVSANDEYLAKTAYEIADAMMIQRERESDSKENKNNV